MDPLTHYGLPLEDRILSVSVLVSGRYLFVQGLCDGSPLILESIYVLSAMELKCFLALTSFSSPSGRNQKEMLGKSMGKELWFSPLCCRQFEKKLVEEMILVLGFPQLETSKRMATKRVLLDPLTKKSQIGYPRMAVILLAPSVPCEWRVILRLVL